MILAALLFGLALAGETSRHLELKVTSPSAEVVLQAEGVLPMDPQAAQVTLGGVRYSVEVVTESRHDTVIVEAVLSELKGKKAKPKEVARPKLTLYEEFPGKVTQTVKAPKGYETPTVDWVLEARWVPVAPAAPASAPPVEAPVEPAPAAPPTASGG